ncbi:MAG: hypothetical protein ACR2ML_14780 [Solirubrobacteraceae bacterium]
MLDRSLQSATAGAELLVDPQSALPLRFACGAVRQRAELGADVGELARLRAL